MKTLYQVIECAEAKIKVLFSSFDEKEAKKQFKKIRTEQNQLEELYEDQYQNNRGEIIALTEVNVPNK